MLEHAWGVGCVCPRALNVHRGLGYYLGPGRVREGMRSTEGPSDA